MHTILFILSFFYYSFFKTDLEGLFQMEYDRTDHNLYFGVKKESWSSIVVCTLNDPKKCSALVTEEEGEIKSFIIVKR